MPNQLSEGERLAALQRYALCDTAFDAELSSFASLAALMCETPAALVTFIDSDRQWIKGRVGVSLETTPRQAAFCSHTILEHDRLLVVPDATTDSRFSDNPLVVGEPGVRFYAGAPLVTADGHALGALCVLDWEPGRLTAGQQAALMSLARNVMTVLELRRSKAELAVSLEARDEALTVLERERRELALKVHERAASLSDVLDRIGDGFITLDSEWRLTYVNRRAAELVGRQPESIVGLRMFPSDDGDVEAVEHACREAARTRTCTSYGVYYHAWSRWFEGRVYPFDGGVAIFFADLTELKKAQEANRLVEARLQRALRASSTGLWEWNLVTDEAFFSPEWKQLLGYADEELPSRIEEFRLRIHPADVVQLALQWQSLEADAQELESEFRIRHRDGSYRWMLGRWTIARDATGRIVESCGSHVDITARKVAEAELVCSREGLRLLSSELLFARDHERMRIAREIHDELGQSLTVLKLDVGWLQRQCDTHDSDPGRRLGEMSATLDQVISTVRRIAKDLRPGVLEDLGLAAAIETQVDEFQARAGIVCRADVRLPDQPPPDVATALFRIVQESLTNVARHARASTVVVRLASEADAWQLTVADDGCGMAVTGEAARRAVGLTGMRERARLTGGTLEIESGPGEGTIVRVRVPKPAVRSSTTGLPDAA